MFSLSLTLCLQQDDFQAVAEFDPAVDHGDCADGDQAILVDIEAAGFDIDDDIAAFFDR
jgi:hypothetical protein